MAGIARGEFGVGEEVGAGCCRAGCLNSKYALMPTIVRINPIKVFTIII